MSSDTRDNTGPDSEETLVRQIEGIIEGDTTDNSDGLSAHDLKFALDIALRMRKSRESKLVVEQLQQGATLRLRIPLSEIQTRVLTPRVYLRWPVVLAALHNGHLIGKQVVENAVQYAEDGNAKARLTLQQHAVHANKYGYFLFRYDAKTIDYRLRAEYSGENFPQATPKFVVSASDALHPDSQHELHKKSVCSADCQLHLPKPKANAPTILDLPDVSLGDEVTDVSWLQRATDEPQGIALVEDIQCRKDMTQFGLSSKAMDAGLLHVREKVNPLRPEFPVTDVAAAIASIKGIVMKDGRKVFFGSKEMPDITPIGNGRSMYTFEHFNSENCESFLPVYTLRGREYPVVLPDDTKNEHYKLIVDWFVKSARLK